MDKVQKPYARVYVRTLGCPKNEADGAALTRHLKRAGWVVVDDPESADAEIVNTCGFIEPTKIESLDAIWEGVARKKGRDKSNRRLIVTGCLAQRYPKNLAKEISGIDAVVGFNRPDLVERALNARQHGGMPVCWVEKPDKVYGEHTTNWRFEQGESAPVSAYIKIGDGCDNACRFCAIPLIRGALRSRNPEAVLAEIRYLIDHGAREVVLISQDTTSWGMDLDSQVDLALLLRQINDIPGTFWIRLMYAHPAFLTERHIEAFGECEKLVPYIDMPMQHISDRMLDIMNRHTTKSKTQVKIDHLRRVRPDLALRTTFIVGHPGETDRDFDELLEFAEENEIERLGAFVFSAEEGTPAARMTDTVSPDLAAERAARLMDAYDCWSAEQSVEKVGSVVPCLLERTDELGSWEGRTPHDAPDIDGRVLLSSGSVDGPGFYDLLIEQAHGVDLLAIRPDNPAA